MVCLIYLYLTSMLFLLKLQFYYCISYLHHIFQFLRLIDKQGRKKQAVEQVETSLMMFTETQLF